jgi:hypothetical protein
MPQNTATNAQAVADESLNEAASSEQPNVVESQQSTGAENSAEPIESIPAKFRGKSAQDIIRAYTELERHAGKLGSEKSHYEKELEAAKQRAQEAEARYQQDAARFQHQAPIQQQQQEADPLSTFDEIFERDPREAVKNLAKTLVAETNKTREQIALEARANQAADYYGKQMRENPDFVAREKDMQRLAQRYAKKLRTEHINDPETIDLLYKLARAERMDSYIEDAVKKSRTAGDMVKQEKRAVFSESSTSSQDSSVPFEELSLDEMAKLLGRTE